MRRFIYKLLFFLGFLAILPGYVVGYNLYHDPFGIIWGDMENQFTEPNQRYLKVKHLIANPNKYDSYVLGSSRAGKIDPRNIDADGSWYNLSYSEGLPKEHLEDLKLLVKKGVKFSKVVIGLDDISYMVSPEHHKSHVSRKGYRNAIRPLIEYLFLMPDSDLLEAIEKVKESNEYPYYDIYQTGMPQSYFKDKWVTNNPEKYVANERFEKPTWAFYYRDRVNQALYETKELVRFCAENRIEVIVYITPLHRSTYLKQDMNAYLNFLEGLTRITGFYDFSGINEVTTDNYWYYETSHFRPIIGDRMIDIMLEGKKDNFGKYVTKDNIESVINEKKHDVELYKVAH